MIWAPPEPENPPEGWGGWAHVQDGLPSFERMRYDQSVTGDDMWVYRGWGPWRKRVGFWGDPQQASRVLRDGYKVKASKNADGSIAYEKERLSWKERRYLKAAARRGARK